MLEKKYLTHTHTQNNHQYLLSKLLRVKKKKNRVTYSKIKMNCSAKTQKYSDMPDGSK